MNISLLRSYRSKNGNATFVYSVSGTASQLEEFAEAQGDYHRVDDETGKPLWFTTRCVGPKGKLIITTNGNVVADMSAFDQAASLAEQYGGNFGNALAMQAAKSILGFDTPAVQQETAENPTVEQDSPELKDL